MVVLSMEQCIAVLAVCFFILGVIVDRMASWFYENYVAIDDDADSDCVVS